MSPKIIIDVRSPMEFACGNVAGSINIPLQEIPLRMNEIKEMNSRVILCCASGARSGNHIGTFGSDNRHRGAASAYNGDFLFYRRQDSVFITAIGVCTHDNDAINITSSDLCRNGRIR